MGSSTMPWAMLIPSIMVTMFMLLGAVYYLITLGDRAWERFKLWKVFKTNEELIDVAFVSYRVKYPNPGWHELAMWIKQEKRLLRWYYHSNLIPVQEELLEIYRTGEPTRILW